MGHNRAVIYALSVSLDGYIEGPDGKIDWSLPDEELHEHFNQQEKEVDVHLYGRGLYENMSGYWPTALHNPEASKEELDYARLWLDMRKVVFSRTLKQVDWNATLAGEDIAGEVARLKEEPGRSLSVGGSGLAASFLKLDLIDEYHMYVFPVILGGGKRMYPALSVSKKLKLADTQVFRSGVVRLRYTR
ncbi:dihydrofolate reductase [Paenibacillus sp. 1011MAR3C5]|uniref:dihydrofolate reductase family protein n=1 Tax=Paenibacillus sp. 1011MAR3C5 TaxID=1675787 RepID=UPI000E6D2CA8|nr:dihydrofolate reductase family protein [Paenibacillus sp. 1011MAR3C5]RJE88448.1 dihydrofolate reductase [Paenibacillus sp. 1011MAR3C5]